MYCFWNLINNCIASLYNISITKWMSEHIGYRASIVLHLKTDCEGINTECHHGSHFHIYLSLAKTVKKIKNQYVKDVMYLWLHRDAFFLVAYSLLLVSIDLKVKQEAFHKHPTSKCFCSHLTLNLWGRSVSCLWPPKGKVPPGVVLMCHWKSWEATFTPQPTVLTLKMSLQEIISLLFFLDH